MIENTQANRQALVDRMMDHRRKLWEEEGTLDHHKDRHKLMIENMLNKMYGDQVEEYFDVWKEFFNV